MSELLYDLLRIDPQGQVEVLLRNSPRDMAESIGLCISDRPGYFWVVTESGRYQDGDPYPIAPVMTEGGAE